MKRVIVPKKQIPPPRKNTIERKSIEKQTSALIKDMSNIANTRPIKTSYKFEPFIKKRYAGNFISIYKNDVISLNTLLCREQKGKYGNFNYCQLFYDKSSNTLGMKFTNKKESNLYKLTEDYDSCRCFAAKPLFMYYNLNTANLRGQYSAKIEYIDNEIGEIWVSN